MTYQLPKGVTPRKSQHTGQVVGYRYRDTKGRQKNLQNVVGAEGSMEFQASLDAALEAALSAGATPAPVKQRVMRTNAGRAFVLNNAGTLGLAWTIYQGEDEDWQLASEKTKRNRRDIIERFLLSRVVDTSDTLWREIAIADIKQPALIAFLKVVRKQAPSQPVKLLRAIRLLVKVAVGQGWIKPEQDPTHLMKEKKTTGRWKSWPAAQLAAFELRHPIGTTPRMAYELTKWTGQRQGDITQMRASHIQTKKWIETQIIDGAEVDTIRVERFLVTSQLKNAERRLRTKGEAKIAPVKMTKMLEEAIAYRLAEIALKGGDDFLLISQLGTPFAKSGMTSQFATWREQAGLSRSGYSQHGLRKVLGGLMATAGATTKERMAVLGHDDEKHAELYAEEADDFRMSATAMGKVEKLVRGK